MNELTYVHGMKPGHGINRLNGNNLASTAVEGTLTPIEFAKGQSVKSKFIRIDDISSLHKSLGVEVTASGGYMGFSANAKVDFASECNFNSHSTYLMIHIEVTNAFLSMDNPVFSSEALELLKNRQPDRFRERFGDVFVSGVSTGGEYFAVYQISGTDESEKEAIATAIHGAYQGGLTSAELGATIQSKKESSHSHLEVSVFNFQLGGSDPSTDLTPEQIMTKARGFALSVRGEFSVPYSMLPAPYSELKRPDDAANQIDIANQCEALAEAWKIRTDLIQLKNDIDYVLFSEARGHEEFETFDVPALTAVRNDLVAQIEAITKRASKCMEDAKQCEFSRFDVSAIKLPKMRQGRADSLALKGQAIAAEDPLASLLRQREPDGPDRRGFDIGMAIADGQTLPGPGKDRFGSALPQDEQGGFFRAVRFSVDRNRNAEFALKGRAVVKADPAAASARSLLPLGLAWLGFDIATGLFGDEALGADHHTSEGPGSEGIRDGLSEEGRMGFRAAVDLYLVKKHKAA
jgi:hypothetical protein